LNGLLVDIHFAFRFHTRWWIPWLASQENLSMKSLQGVEKLYVLNFSLTRLWQSVCY